MNLLFNEFMGFPVLVKDLLKELLEDDWRYVQFNINDCIYYYYNEDEGSLEFNEEYIKVIVDNTVSYITYSSIDCIYINKCEIIEDELIEEDNNTETEEAFDEFNWTGNRIIF